MRARVITFLPVFPWRVTYNCELQDDQNDETPDASVNDQHQEETHQESQAADSVGTANEPIRSDVDLSKNNTESNDGMEYEERGQSYKRQFTTDSDSDRAASARRTWLRPAPSLSNRRNEDKNIKGAKVPDKPPSK